MNRTVLPPRMLGLRAGIHLRDWLLMILALAAFTAAAMIAIQAVNDAGDAAEAPVLAERPDVSEHVPTGIEDRSAARRNAILIAVGAGVLCVGSLVLALGILAPRHARMRVCAIHGREVVVRISDTRVVHRRGKPTRRRVYTVAPIDGYGRDGPPFTIAIDLDRRTPLFADPTERTAFALYNDGDEPHLILLCHDLEPFDLTADEKAEGVRRAIAARAAAAPVRNADGPARGRPV